MQLLEGCGIRFTAHYAMLTNETPESERAAVERELTSAMEAGNICMVNFFGHQLVVGHDEDGFVMLQPWNGMAFSEIRRLSFGRREQCMQEAARGAIAYATKLYHSPAAFEVPGDRIGAGAYDNWIVGVERGLGTGRGGFGNAEDCRLRACNLKQTFKLW